MDNRIVLGLVVAVALLPASPGWASGQGQATSTPVDGTLSEMEIDITSVAGQLQLFVGAEIGQPANRRIGRSPEWLTIRCQGQGAEGHCIGTTNEKGEFWPGECLILALDADEQEMILSGDQLCRKLDSLNQWKLQLDFAQGTVVAQDLSRPPSEGPGSSNAGAAASTQTNVFRRGSNAVGGGVSLIPERFNRRVFNSTAKQP